MLTTKRKWLDEPVPYLGCEAKENIEPGLQMKRFCVHSETLLQSPWLHSGSDKQISMPAQHNMSYHHGNITAESQYHGSTTIHSQLVDDAPMEGVNEVSLSSVPPKESSTNTATSVAPPMTVAPSVSRICSRCAAGQSGHFNHVLL